MSTSNTVHGYGKTYPTDCYSWNLTFQIWFWDDKATERWQGLVYSWSRNLKRTEHLDNCELSDKSGLCYTRGSYDCTMHTFSKLSETVIHLSTCCGCHHMFWVFNRNLGLYVIVFLRLLLAALFIVWNNQGTQPKHHTLSLEIILNSTQNQ